MNPLACPRSSHSRLLLPLYLLALIISFSAYAEASPVERLLPPKPQISDYRNQDDFVKDVLAWKRRKLTLEEQYRNGELTLPPEKPEHDPDDWHHVTGPENLDQALKNAEGYEQPNYKEKYRFDRTTHISFPLPKLQSTDMARQQIQGGLPIKTEQEDKIDKQRLPELILEEARQSKPRNQQTPEPAIPDALLNSELATELSTQPAP